MNNLNKLDHPAICSLLLNPPSNFRGDCPDYAEDFDLIISDDVVLSCRSYLSALESPTLIYFHGGSENTDSFNTDAQNFKQTGINVVLASYRGFGKSSGTPACSTLITDAQLLFTRIFEWLRTKNYTGPVCVMGRSLGSICAIDVTLNNPERIKAMILESAVGEIGTFLTSMGLENSIREKVGEEDFKNLEKISKIKTPTLIFHGSRDTLVPISQAEKLQASSGARNKQFLVIPGAEHYNVSIAGGTLYYQTIKGFIDTVCGINTWRNRRKKYMDQVGEGE